MCEGYLFQDNKAARNTINNVSKKDYSYLIILKYIMYDEGVYEEHLKFVCGETLENPTLYDIFKHDANDFNIIKIKSPHRSPRTVRYKK